LSTHLRGNQINNSGGTSGLLLASRLASAPSKPSVIVLEAGKDRSDLEYRIPSKRFSLAFTNPELDHGYLTVPQTALGGRQLPYQRGKGLGGSTLTNFMSEHSKWPSTNMSCFGLLTWLVYLSGSKEDYNYWGELVGDDTWKWENTHRRLQEVS